MGWEHNCCRMSGNIKLVDNFSILNHIDRLSLKDIKN